MPRYDSDSICTLTDNSRPSDRRAKVRKNDVPTFHSLLSFVVTGARARDKKERQKKRRRKRKGEQRGAKVVLYVFR